MPKVKLCVKRQVTLPKSLVEQLKLKPGETLEAYATDDLGIVLVPTKKIPKDQRWFWTEAWQRRYREALEDVKAGRVKTFETIEDLIRDLRS
mgnify:CR=1 FL=1